MPPPPGRRPAPRRPVVARPLLAAEHLRQRSLAQPAEGELPEIVVRSPTWHAHLFKKRLGEFSSAARHGDLVRLFTVDRQPLGIGYFNPRAETAVRVLTRQEEPLDDTFWEQRIAAAVELRRASLRLDETTNAYRLIHGEGDRLPGIVVDRLGDVLVSEVYTLAMYQRSVDLMQRLSARMELPHWLIRTAPHTGDQEGFEADWLSSDNAPGRVVIREQGVEFEVDLRQGHKTGFFCDQRDNRRQLVEWRRGRTLLDLCCYTGGFAVPAALADPELEVTAVDLDETAIAVARKNAQRNRTKLKCVHADAFAYMRDMLRNGKTFDTVVLDPPKLIHGRAEIEEGQRKYHDFNRLAMQLVAPGGLLLTCSCSGLLPPEEFAKIISSAAPGNRWLQVLRRTGAAADHPIAGDCPETEYLKAIWARVW
jgi:23S rRNA (cytosine1962-C5)-methyltransferase